jgi:hypothetical protein
MGLMWSGRWKNIVNLIPQKPQKNMKFNIHKYNYSLMANLPPNYCHGTKTTACLIKGSSELGVSKPFAVPYTSVS